MGGRKPTTARVPPCRGIGNITSERPHHGSHGLLNPPYTELRRMLVGVRKPTSARVAERRRIRSVTSERTHHGSHGLLNPSYMEAKGL